jgi:peptide/nickel transport system permease protein
VPNFWLGLVAILYLAVGLGWFPASGFVPFTEDPLANLHHLLLPAFVLGSGIAAIVMRQTRSAMLSRSVPTTSAQRGPRASRPAA